MELEFTDQKKKLNATSALASKYRNKTTNSHCNFSFCVATGQFLLEQSRLAEAAEMAETAAQLESSEFDVVFNAAHMLRFVRFDSTVAPNSCTFPINLALSLVKAQMLRGENKQRRPSHLIAVFSHPQRLAEAHTDGEKLF